MDFSFRAITVWPGQPTRNRKRAPFRTSYGRTLLLLERELRFLGAKNIILETFMSDRDIRMDGKPRADARKPSAPGVILTFESKVGPLSYPCDTFDDWEDNLRAIALALEALRAVDRYGVTKRAEQYRGWQQIENKLVPQQLSREDALQVLLRLSGENAVAGDDKATQQTLYRKAALKYHPDRNGGDDSAFKRLNQAKEALGI